VLAVLASAWHSELGRQAWQRLSSKMAGAHRP